jgi:hypothetical protein
MKPLRVIWQSVCKHRFDYGDMVHHCDRENTDERIEWACWRCGKIFMRHCGLEILYCGKVEAKSS